MIKKIILLWFLFGSFFVLFSQEDTNNIKKKNTYSDRVTNEYGVPMQGVKVRVRASNSTDVTDSNGDFTVIAKKGDVIILSKNGRRINSYVYTGSGEYKVTDESDNQQRSIFREKLDSAIIFQKKKPLQAISYVEKALQNTTKKYEKAKAFEVLGDIYLKLKQYDLAKSNYQLAFDVQKRNLDIKLKLTKVTFILGNKTVSKLAYQSILNAKQIKTIQKIKALEGLADIQKTENNFALALENYQEALRLAIKKKYDIKITILSDKIAQIHALQGNLKKSKTYFGNSIKSAKNVNKAKAIIQSEKAANFYRKNNQIDAEIALRKDNLKKLESVVSKPELEEILTEDKKISKQKIKKDIGKALNKKQNYTEAIEYFEESVKDASAENDIETKKEAIQGLTEAYVALGDDSKALINYKKYTELVDLLYKKKEEEIAKAVNLGKELSQKQNRILSLEKDRVFNENKLKLVKTEQELISENSKRQKTIIYSLIGGLLLLVLALFFMFKSNKQQQISNNLLALKSLRSQMNPHFIFNALNSVNSFIAINDERAANRYLTNFSTLMRSVLDNSEKDFISLEQELELLELYLKLEHTRFSDKFDYQINISNLIEIKTYTIPPMLIQPYVENAVWHGLRYKHEKGFLHINILPKDENSIQIEIIDNGVGREKSKQLKSKNQLMQKSKGMQNIKQRIKILNEMYQNKVSVEIQDLNLDKTGTKVILVLSKK